MDLTKLVSTTVIAGWVRAGVGAGLAALVAKNQTLASILDPTTQGAIAVAASMVVVGAWSHLAKVIASKGQSQ